MYAPEYRPDSPVTPFAVSRLGTLMRAQADDPQEAWGVLNPGCARGRDDNLYLFPRVVAQGNCSSIGIARVHFGPHGNPEGVERLGIALQPEEGYERMSPSQYGCEDARVTYVPLLDRYIMTYVAITPMGPRIALALSDDLFEWQRLGLVDFKLEYDVDLNVYNNKDGLLFPEPVIGPHGHPALALLHRPMYLLTTNNLDHSIELPRPANITNPRESIWISYADLTAARADPETLTRVTHHQQVATPRFAWEAEKIGGGAPPLLTHLGWLVVYHGISRFGAMSARRSKGRIRRYCAGVMVLDRNDPRRVLYRSPEPILAPETNDELRGAVDNVVFPTGLDLRGPAAPGSRIDMYYGMADMSIGVGRFTLPETLPDS